MQSVFLFRLVAGGHSTSAKTKYEFCYLENVIGGVVNYCLTQKLFRRYAWKVSRAENLNLVRARSWTTTRAMHLLKSQMDLVTR